jgi:diguanylate cyclase (GGDEF)-like protein
MSRHNTNLRQQAIQESKYLKDVLNEQLASLQEMNQKLVNASIQLQIKTDQVQRAEEQMSQLAHHDFLTKLPNRLQFNDQLEHEIALARRHGTTLAVLFIDLDKFKNVNDSLGHGIGDLLLQSVANNLRAAVRSTDTVSRQGGDEFMILLPDVKNKADIDHKVRKIHQIITATHHIADHMLQVGASIGISIFPDDGTDAETLVLRADAAMYAAKKSGRDQYQFFSQAMNDHTVEQQTLETGLHCALVRGEMELYYQAQITLETGTICGAEALLRWHHPTRGLLLPGIFVPVAEGCGAIIPIGRWVLREACRQAQCWLESGLLRGTISVNISILEFIREDFLDEVRAALRDTGLPPHYLDLEVTETLLMKNVEFTVLKLHALRSMGVKISIDDFGTGCSSLSSLMHFPVDCLKIDRSFVSDICHNNEGCCLVSPIIGIGKCLKQHVIAEGIETREQLDYLRQNECATGQGYYLHEPASAANFGDFLQAKSSAGLSEIVH